MKESLHIAADARRRCSADLSPFQLEQLHLIVHAVVKQHIIGSLLM
jgi:hypothetical protein